MIAQVPADENLFLARNFWTLYAPYLGLLCVEELGDCLT